MKEKELLVQWLEEFKSQYGHYSQSEPTISSVEKALTLYESTVSKLKVPLDIQNARNARKKDGSCLEYGFDHHYSGFESLVRHIANTSIFTI